MDNVVSDEQLNFCISDKKYSGKGDLEKSVVGMIPSIIRGDWLLGSKGSLSFGRPYQKVVFLLATGSNAQR
jgi:hypothetical protein